VRRRALVRERARVLAKATVSSRARLEAPVEEPIALAHADQAVAVPSLAAAARPGPLCTSSASAASVRAATSATERLEEARTVRQIVVCLNDDG
jgi:hypothetical protein